ncbi:ATP-dependent DNA helicase pif1 [Lecanosticta acicola]|uniref:ATP-dependent DNA helicase n=1 Tax=Lecanosticta acicola TaxID=111012 RepID=A0AAI8YYU8_9PEZI|nr:ATP-dependent DNA helicase pif1 [Lecanosticta acicola]
MPEFFSQLVAGFGLNAGGSIRSERREGENGQGRASEYPLQRGGAVGKFQQNLNDIAHVEMMNKKRRRIATSGGRTSLESPPNGSNGAVLTPRSKQPKSTGKISPYFPVKETRATTSRVQTYSGDPSAGSNNEISPTLIPPSSTFPSGSIWSDEDVQFLRDAREEHAIRVNNVVSTGVGAGVGHDPPERLCTAREEESDENDSPPGTMGCSQWSFQFLDAGTQHNEERIQRAATDRGSDGDGSAALQALSQSGGTQPGNLSQPARSQPARSQPDNGIASTFHCSISWTACIDRLDALVLEQSGGQGIADGDGRAAAKWHAVRRGHRPGVYEDPDEALQQMDGFSNALYKACDTEEEGNYFVNHDKNGCQGSCCREDEIVLSEEQAKLMRTVQELKNVCCLGPGGTGKSFITRLLTKELTEKGLLVSITAASSLAALTIGGRTVESWAGFTLETKKKPLVQVLRQALNSPSYNRILETHILVIDEISMVSSVVMYRLDKLCRFVRSRLDEPFGGIQIIAMGDFRQLPPVKPFEYCADCGVATNVDVVCPQCRKDWSEAEPLAFGCHVWDECVFSYLALTKPFRQIDEAFFNILSKVRLGELSDADANLLLHHDSDTTDGIHLYPRNDDVDEHNRKRLNELPGPSQTYKCVDEFVWNGTSPQDWELARNMADTKYHEHRLDRRSELRVGAQVMLTAHVNERLGLVNGVQGKIVGWQSVPKVNAQWGEFYPDRKRNVAAWCEQNGIDRLPVIRTKDVEQFVVLPICMVESIGQLVEGSEPTVVARAQIPLTLAWALTIHRVQSQEFDKIIVHMDRIWSRELAYVALSRAKDLKGLEVVCRDGLNSLKRGGRLTASERTRTLDIWSKTHYSAITI